MADFFKGLAGGFGTGLQFGQAMRERDERERLREAMGLTPQAMEQRQATPEELSRAQAEAQGLAAEDARTFGLTPQDQAMYAPQMPVEGQRIGATQYGLGGQTFSRMPTQQEIESARYSAAANVIAERDPAAAMRMRQEQVRMQREAELAPLQLEQLRGSIAGQEQQRALTGIQLSDAQRKQKQQTDFDTGFAKINEQKFEKPEERTAAILSLVESTQGVQARQQLESSYTTNELNQISLQSKKFDEGFRQSRAKGVIPALEWFDEQNTSFKLERDPKNPFRYIQVNQDGTRSVFADAKNERELGMIVDAKAKPGGFLELAKYDLDVKKADAAIASEKAKAGYYAQGGRQTPVMLVNDKGEPTPVYMDRLPVVNGVVQLPQGLRMPKDVQQATAAQNRAYEVLTKTDAWERAERAGDTATMNKLLTNRGLDPAQFGGTGMKGWGEQGGAASQTTAPGQPAQQSMAAPARAPSAGLMTPQQLAAAQQQQQAQTQEQQQQNTAAGVRASGLGREALMLREEAAGYTPIIIQQMTPRQADELRRRYGRYLTPEQMRAVNQAM